MVKALILNSGVGSRLKSIEMCKCLTRLDDDVSILKMQISALLRCGVEEIVITTGPYAQLLEEYVAEQFPSGKTTFVHNPLYNSTNYIYSIFLALEYLQDCDVLLLHGDLVFEQNVLQDLLAAENSVMAVDFAKPLPEKDFKARLRANRIVAVGVDIFDDVVYAQPMYKLLSSDWDIWAEHISCFCKRGETGVYAENAFNEVSSRISLSPFDITGRVCFEVDTDNDLALAREAYAKMPDRLQTVYAGYNSRIHIKKVLEDIGVKKAFVVHGIESNETKQLFGEDAVYFSDFKPNPDIADVENGIRLFAQEACDFIASIGGGSAIDVAKCVKDSKPDVLHLAIPTTAGTGSESTGFAVVYKDGVKHTVDKDYLLPDYTVLDPRFLESLPEYHKKSTLLDAMCHAVESLWAKKKTPVSATYARSALRSIKDNAAGYLSGDMGCAERVLYAANLSGKAINISRTTAAHAMSYKLSTIFKIAHGHAAALCLEPVWRNLLNTANAPEELSNTELARFAELYASMNLSTILDDYSGDNDALLRLLTSSVNIERLNNHPTLLTEDELCNMYSEILGKR